MNITAESAFLFRHRHRSVNRHPYVFNVFKRPLALFVLRTLKDVGRFKFLGQDGDGNILFRCWKPKDHFLKMSFLTNVVKALLVE